VRQTWAVPVQDEMDDHQPDNGTGREERLQSRLGKQGADNHPYQEARQEEKDGQRIMVIFSRWVGNWLRHGLTGHFFRGSILRLPDSVSGIGRFVIVQLDMVRMDNARVPARTMCRPRLSATVETYSPSP
ncbi:MAG TPA: hypothetical protein VF707_13430, partial [Ardenticatenaceae bacterium]